MENTQRVFDRFNGIAMTPSEKRFSDECEMIRALNFSNAFTQGKVAENILEDMREENPILNEIERNEKACRMFDEYFDLKEDLALSIVKAFEKDPSQIEAKLKEVQDQWELCESWLLNMARKKGIDADLSGWTNSIKAYREQKAQLLQRMIDRRTRGIH